MQPSSGETRERLLHVVGWLCFLGGLSASFLAFQRGGGDFAVLQAMGRGVLTGENVYALNGFGEVGEGVMGMVYPPATGFVMLPFAILPYAIGKALWFVVMNGTLLAGVRALVRVVSPQAPPHFPLIAAGIVLASSSIRWGMMLLQGAPFVLGLLMLTVWALHSGRLRTAIACAAVASCFKITLALPFLGLLLLHRQLVGAVLCGGAWVGFNALGFLRMGAVAFATYRANVASFEAVGESNINGPDPWFGAALPRLDWVFLYYGASGSLAASRLAALLSSAGVALWLLIEGLRARAPISLNVTTLFLGPLVCLGSLAVYHHQYDACLFLAPALLLALGPEELRKPRWALGAAVPLVILIVILPIGKAQDIAESLLGARGVGLLKLSFPVALTLALVGLLVILRRHLAGRSTRGAALGSRQIPGPDLNARVNSRR